MPKTDDFRVKGGWFLIDILNYIRGQGAPKMGIVQSVTSLTPPEYSPMLTLARRCSAGRGDHCAGERVSQQLHCRPVDKS